MSLQTPKERTAPSLCEDKLKKKKRPSNSTPAQREKKKRSKEMEKWEKKVPRNTNLPSHPSPPPPPLFFFFLFPLAKAVLLLTCQPGRLRAEVRSDQTLPIRLLLFLPFASGGFSSSSLAPHLFAQRSSVRSVVRHAVVSHDHQARAVERVLCRRNRS